jgi:hypothetical protein
MVVTATEFKTQFGKMFNLAYEKGEKITIKRNDGAVVEVRRLMSERERAMREIREMLKGVPEEFGRLTDEEIRDMRLAERAR